VRKLNLMGDFAMPAPRTTDEFLDLVLKSSVVDNDRLRTYFTEARDTHALPSEPAKVATLMVRDGILTQFQAEQLLKGKWRRFSIGRYKVLERLGSGRQGTVYLCMHEPTHRRVAIKVLPACSVNDPSLLERFYREARALSGLDHPNIVRAYDIDQDETIHFLVMEYIDGSSLRYITEKCGPMAVLRAAHYMRQAALGLQHAHETSGIVHRDIKPDDVLVDRGGCVKIIDMGMARFSGDAALITTRYEKAVLGTPDYMAPEQAVDPHHVDIRADIYSLGATFYFCLTRYTPFPGGSVTQKLLRLPSQQPEPLRRLRPKIPEGLAALIECMMAKEPAQRPQSPQEVADALAPFTREPIAPPPEDEMPRLCPAASGGLQPPTDSRDVQ
jgi:serine/threonine protein kinase